MLACICSIGFCTICIFMLFSRFWAGKFSICDSKDWFARKPLHLLQSFGSARGYGIVFPVPGTLGRTKASAVLPGRDALLLYLKWRYDTGLFRLIQEIGWGMSQRPEFWEIWRKGFRRYRDRRVVCEDDRCMVYDNRLIVLVDTGW